MLRLGREFRWPGGRHVAVVFNVAFEGWSDGKAPGIGPMGNPLPGGTFDTNALSWGHYGAVRGIARLLAVLERGARASVMVSGVFAERAPAGEAIAAAGHEIVAHAYAQEVIPAQLSPSRTAPASSRPPSCWRGGRQRPRGWISPRGTPGAETARLLLETGYAWHGDVFDDDRPYVQVFDRADRRHPAHHGDQRPAACHALRPLARANMSSCSTTISPACACRRGRGGDDRCHRPHPRLWPTLGRLGL